MTRSGFACAWTAITFGAALSLCGCGSAPGAPPAVADIPSNWVHPAEGEPARHWLATFDTFDPTPLVDQAIEENHALAQQRAVLDSARLGVELARASRLPSLDLTLTGQRGRSAPGAGTGGHFDLGATLALQLDVWGKLSDRERAAFLAFGAEQARYRAAEQRLVASVVRAAFDVIEAAEIQALFDRRLHNLAESLDIIESGYRRGLNAAVDVYLARNTLEREKAAEADHRQRQVQAAATLELLLGDYPAGALELPATLPALVDPAGAGAPAGLLLRRADIQEAWLEVLAADAELAVAHKDRFPGFSLTANARDSAGAFGRLLDGGPLAWSIAASLAQPLFQGGRLRTLHEQARLRLGQAERRYLETVYRAFSEVEVELSRASRLEARHEAIDGAKASAEAAVALAFEEYRGGLTDYIVVLEAQRRVFDAEMAAVRLRNQLLQGRVALLIALGGDY